jgi:hypothetical protein
VVRNMLKRIEKADDAMGTGDFHLSPEELA